MSPRTPVRVVESLVLPGISRPLPASWLAGWLRHAAAADPTAAPSGPGTDALDATAAPSGGATALLVVPVAAIGAAFVARRRSARR